MEILGTPGDDVLTGGNSDDVIDGRAGHDVLSGGGGSDHLRGGLGDDLLTGGAGADVFYFRPGDGDDVLTDFNAAEGDILILEGGWIYATVGHRFDEITLDINNGQGTVTIRNVNLSQVAGSIRFAPPPTAPVIEIGRSNDRITGSVAGETIRGHDGTDVIDGRGGDDTIDGGAYDDILSGGAGLDWLTGGQGGDLFVFHPGDGGAVIMDFNPAEGDRLWLQGPLSWSVSQNDVTGHILLSWHEMGGGEGFVQILNTTRVAVEGSLTVVLFDFVVEAVTGDQQGSGLADSMPGTLGADRIDGGLGDDIIDGLAGDDFIQGGGGDDRLLGGAGDDVIQGGPGADTVTGGPGRDIFYLRPGGDTDVITDFDWWDDRIDVGQRAVTQIFQQGADTVIEITGGARLVLQNTPAHYLGMRNFLQTAQMPLFAVQPGPLVVVGTAGDDVLTGGDFDDEVRGLGGNDTLSGGAGNDLLTGGDGDDVILGDEGQDTIDGGAGIDTYVMGGPGGTVDLYANVRTNTGQGGDLFIGVENVRGSAGDDSITGDAGDNRLEGGDGADFLSGMWGADLLYGGAGDDDLRAGVSGNDTAWGGIGDDHILAYRRGGETVDLVVLHGEDGDDEIRVTAELRGTDTVRLFGGAGADLLEVAGATSALMDGGDGDDRITVFEGSGTYDIRLGQGRDLIRFDAFNWDGTDKYGSGGATIVVQDFVAGDAGDRIDLLSLVGRTVTNFTPGQNYFTTGHFRLVQVGADTRLEMDKNGGGDGFALLALFRNTQATAFSAANFGGYSPTGGAVAGETFTGTEQYDQLHGTYGDDVMRGLGGGDLLFGHAGDDRLEGGDGDDTLEGGDGSDRLEGGLGADTLRDSGGDDVLLGGDGDDTLEVRPDGLGPFPPPEPGSSPTERPPRDGYVILMDGGAGDDVLEFSAPDRWIDTVTAIGGEGADFISVEFALNAIYSAGAGDDELKVTLGGGDYKVTTGAGRDVVVLEYGASMAGAEGPFALRITDFTAGAGGDRLDVGGFLRIRFEGDWNQDPFAIGWFRVMQTGGHSYLQTLNAAGTGYATLATLSGVEAWTLTGDNFVDDGLSFAPGDLLIVGQAANESLRGGAANDTITGAGGDDVITGGLGNDAIDGGAGHDIVVVSGDASAYRLVRHGDAFLLKGPDGRDSLTGVESIRFGDGRVLELNRMYGPEVDARAWADGRIPEALLSHGAGGGDRPLVLPGVTDPGLRDGKDGGRPEVLPGDGDADGWIWKDDGGPRVLPAAEDVLALALDRAALPERAWSDRMPTLDPGLGLHPAERPGWGGDDWQF